MDDYSSRFLIESKEKWADVIKKVPTLNFDKEWGIKIIPPYGGAMARFLVMNGTNVVCSVYLDWYDRLGVVGEPYYELYPYSDDVKRYLLDNTDDLISDIRDIFNSGEFLK